MKHERTTRKYKKSQHLHVLTFVNTLFKTIISQLEGMQLASSNNQYKFLDGVLMTYRHLPSRIARRKLEIETEHSTDINIGASKTNRVIKRTEWLVERFDSDIKRKGWSAN
ncbi:phage transcriptional regulator, RinA family [Streptococcus suis R61]|uniref:Phage transcriptional regulator, RinA family n=1 Tax=Streptococcus suis R61 TaxID=996306 RepID=A0AA87F735_STRSU|nr:hypothetical protein [Streptococcus suis]EHC02135.1 phage transcriptional regulator, RinA family [Streptococcus suis R61]ATZ04682.1 hypothetical protein CVO91_12670 [Streptococcus suis]MBY4955164.1 hypothetical protein [Streptococcus suis]MBY4981288.1 hypothetical protein [Streptococcus suis]MBY4991993.1 hypothetical protein [Streptococcus suis]